MARRPLKTFAGYVAAIAIGILLAPAFEFGHPTEWRRSALDLAGPLHEAVTIRLLREGVNIRCGRFTTASNIVGFPKGERFVAIFGQRWQYRLEGRPRRDFEAFWDTCSRLASPAALNEWPYYALFGK